MTEKMDSHDEKAHIENASITDAKHETGSVVSRRDP